MPIADLSNPQHRQQIGEHVGYFCKSMARGIFEGKRIDGIQLKTIRDVLVWNEKRYIDESVRAIDDAKKRIADLAEQSARQKVDERDLSYARSTIASSVERVKRSQILYSGLANKPYGPSNIDSVAQPAPAKAAPAPVQSTSGNSSLPASTEAVAGTKADTSSAEANAVPGSTSAARDAICKGLDLAVTSEQLDCLERKFSDADKKLNEIYKVRMDSLPETRRPILKKDQMTWIREKEDKCQKAGDGAEGGSLQAVLVADCKLKRTEERLTYLETYR